MSKQTLAIVGKKWQNSEVGEYNAAIAVFFEELAGIFVARYCLVQEVVKSWPL